MGKCAEFFHGTTGLGNYRAGEGQSWLGASVFVRGPEPIYGTTGSSAPAFTADTGLGGAAFGDPRAGQGDPVGQGEPGVKTGTYLSGLPVFLWSQRGDHGLNGNGMNGSVWVVVWVLRSRITGTHRWPFRLGLKGQRAGRRRSRTKGAPT